MFAMTQKNTKGAYRVTIGKKIINFPSTLRHRRTQTRVNSLRHNVGLIGFW